MVGQRFCKGMCGPGRGRSIAPRGIRSRAPAEALGAALAAASRAPKSILAGIYTPKAQRHLGDSGASVPSYAGFCASALVAATGLEPVTRGL